MDEIPPNSEFEIWQDDMPVAVCGGPRLEAIREAARYVAQYAQDGPVQVYEVARWEVTMDELLKQTLS